MNRKGNNGQSGNSSGGWAKSKDKLGMVTAEQRRSHWWFQV